MLVDVTSMFFYHFSRRFQFFPCRVDCHSYGWLETVKAVSDSDFRVFSNLMPKDFASIQNACMCLWICSPNNIFPALLGRTQKVPTCQAWMLRKGYGYSGSRDEIRTTGVGTGPLGVGAPRERTVPGRRLRALRKMIPFRLQQLFQFSFLLFCNTSITSEGKQVIGS